MAAHAADLAACKARLVEAPLLARAPARLHDHLRTLLAHTTDGGKLHRSFIVRSTAEAVAACCGGAGRRGALRDDDDDLRRACWNVEVLQAFLLVEDDIMDDSATRRGRPSWWTVVDSKALALNDGLVLMALADALLAEMADGGLSAKIRAVWDEVQLATTFGQCLDARGEAVYSVADDFSMALWEETVVHKTAYYTFYDPVAKGVLLAKLDDAALEARLLEEARRLGVLVGRLFQLQDDYLDAFGDPSVTGKVGTDIEDRKCTWLAARALEVASAEQRARFLALYGRDKEAATVAEVRALYRELGLVEAYAAECARLGGEVRAACAASHPSLALVFAEVLAALDGRTK
jgi:farnesyl diphosphate synthase